MKIGEKVAVISDIHGNSWALKEVLNDIQDRDIELIFNLGDSLYGPLDPVGTFDLLKKFNIYSISGNEDRIILEHIEKRTKNTTLNYVLDSIDDDIITWLENLRKTMIVDEFFLCHGTIQSDKDYLFEKVSEKEVILKSEKEIVNEIKNVSQKIICCGHSHQFHVISLSSHQSVVNPGSVGLQAYEDDIPLYHKMETGHNKASYCVITKEKKQYTFDNILVSYDWKSAAEYALKNNNEKWAKWLRAGMV